MSLSLRLRYQQASFAPFASATKPNPQDKLESQRPQVSLLTHLAQTNSSSSLQSPQADSNRNPTHLPKSSWRSPRSEEHTSELQSWLHLVCRLLLEKKT